MYIVIVGGNMTTEYLVSAMKGNHHRVTVIEEDLETVERLVEVLPRRVTVVYGDGCDSEAQRDAGVGDADLFIALTGHDETNLVACEIAMAAFDVPRCIASVRSPKNERIFREVGIEPVSSTGLIARMIEEEAVIGDMSMVEAYLFRFVFTYAATFAGCLGYTYMKEKIKEHLQNAHKRTD